MKHNVNNKYCTIMRELIRILRKVENKEITPKEAHPQVLDLFGVINWVAVSEKLPPRPDEYYLVVVRNKNKDGGIPLVDLGNFTSDGVWIKHYTWEDVVYWAEVPEPPCL